MSVKVVAWVFENSESEGNDRLVLLALADGAGDDGSCDWAFVDRLSKNARLREEEVIASICRLATLGELVRTRCMGYRIAMPMTPVERKEQPPHWAKKRRIELGEASGWTCYYCRRVGKPDIGPDDRLWHVDHGYPQVLGGDSLKGVLVRKWLAEDDNLILSCATCNLQKGIKTREAFAREML